MVQAFGQLQIISLANALESTSARLGYLLRDTSSLMEYMHRDQVLALVDQQQARPLALLFAPQVLVHLARDIEFRSISAQSHRSHK